MTASHQLVANCGLYASPVFFSRRVLRAARVGVYSNDSAQEAEKHEDSEDSDSAESSDAKANANKQ